MKILLIETDVWASRGLQAGIKEMFPEDDLIDAACLPTASLLLEREKPHCVLLGAHFVSTQACVNWLPDHHKQLKNVRVIALVSSIKPITAQRVLESGVTVLVDASEPLQNLSQIMRLVFHCGSAEISDDASCSVLTLGNLACLFQQQLPRITNSERCILEMLCAGATYTEISLNLAISEGTVKTHVKHLREKIRVANLSQLIVRASEYGLCEVGSSEGNWPPRRE